MLSSIDSDKLQQKSKWFGGFQFRVLEFLDFGNHDQVKVQTVFSNSNYIVEINNEKVKWKE